MKITELRNLLSDKRVIEEINKHLWIESQKAGYSIGIERATDEWLKLYAQDWLKYNEPLKYEKIKTRAKKKTTKKPAKKKVVKKIAKKVVTKKKAAHAKKKTTKKKSK